MKDLFYMGGTLFMSMLTIILILMLAWFIINLVSYFSKRPQIDLIRRRMRHVKSLGLLALIIGILGQLIGLYMAFEHIEAAGDVSQAIVFGGVKVSMVTTLYGVFIYIASLITWMLSDVLLFSRESEDTP
ncbi:MAG: MotA/TolQ/ExbB proton channel family protein [Bacteroidales bacterium]|nr:MotA/TolQ/ExbB proton channel family protein [Bacteroidales bacterium]